MVFEYSVTGYTRIFRSLTAPFVLKRSSQGSRSETEPEASFCRGFYLSLFNVLKTRAIDVDMSGANVLEKIHKAFRKVLLPLATTMPISHEVCKRTVETVERRLITLKRRLLNKFSEASFSTVFWIDIMQLFENDVCEVVGEQDTQSMSEVYKERYIDFAVYFQPKGSKPLNILLAELSKTQLYDGILSHKDEEKLATAMGAAFLDLVGSTVHLGEAFVKTLIVYGLLLGATDFEICVLYCDFGPGVASKPGEPLRPFTMVFRTSRRRWRFRLAGANYDYMRHVGADEFCCPGDDPVFKDAEQPIDFASSECTNIEITEVCNFNKAMGVKTEDPTMTTGKDPRYRSSRSHLEYFRTKFQKERVNRRGVQALSRLVELVQAEAARVAAALEKKRRPPRDDSYHYPQYRAEVMTRAREYSASGQPTGNPVQQGLTQIAQIGGLTPQKWSSASRLTESQPPSPTLQPISCTDEWEEKSARTDGMMCVDVEKEHARYEITVYKNEVIAASPFFPKLLDYKFVPGKVCLTVEEVVPLSKMPPSQFSLFHDRISWHLIMYRALLDIMGALRTLHSIKFVHRDISPNNVGYNKRLGLWQLFDFDQAYPFEIAATEVRFGGTPNYCSRRFEETGLFAPSDDYIALSLTCRYIFESVNLYVPDDIDAFLNQIEGADASDFDDLYMSAFDLFCANFKQDKVGDIEQDRSYQEALKIIQSMSIIA